MLPSSFFLAAAAFWSNWLVLRGLSRCGWRGRLPRFGPLFLCVLDVCVLSLRSSLCSRMFLWGQRLSFWPFYVALATLIFFSTRGVLKSHERPHKKTAGAYLGVIPPAVLAALLQRCCKCPKNPVKGLKAGAVCAALGE